MGPRRLLTGRRVGERKRGGKEGSWRLPTHQAAEPGAGCCVLSPPLLPPPLPCVLTLLTASLPLSPIPSPPPSPSAFSALSPPPLLFRESSDLQPTGQRYCPAEYVLHSLSRSDDQLGAQRLRIEEKVNMAPKSHPTDLTRPKGEHLHSTKPAALPVFPQQGWLHQPPSI